MIACDFIFNFTPKELLYMKNNSSKYELKCSTALHLPGMDYGAV
jgi:hypothetical protein